ncbi:hypothetical protein QCA50_015098 [Cerrena zonata]|uniref:Tafazzin family protein n=1 Tax=Cerrena zonata TaxID=2478898 RepID=A0AAW0FWL7_9APHY
MSSLLSKLTVGTIGITCKTFLNIGYCSSVTVNGLENLVEALNSDERNSGRGIITISNHISTLDDPVTWGILPTRYFFNTRTTRWVLGASDIMFTNPLLSVFFRKGQVIETFRGGGIFQPAVDTAVDKLNEGAWIHLFGEGKVNQPKVDEKRDDILPHDLLRFKWGVGRIVMEAVKPPIIIPMWLTGELYCFDKIMPENRQGLSKFFPRSGAHLSVTVGKPIDDDEVKRTIIDNKSEFSGQCVETKDRTPDSLVHKSEEGWLADAVHENRDVSLLMHTNNMRFISVTSFCVLITAMVNGAQVEFFTNKACDSASETYRGDCNFCSDPPGGKPLSCSEFLAILSVRTDWGAVRFSDIPSDFRVTVHNQDKCTSASQVGQGFGPACWIQGATKIRSAWVACAGQRLESFNTTQEQDAEQVHE